MSEIIGLTKNGVGNCKFMQHAIFWQIYATCNFFANIFVCTVLTDLLDTLCQ